MMLTQPAIADATMTAADPEFTEEVCECDVALFVLRTGDGPIKVLEAHLCEDEFSPSGLAFDFTAYGFDGKGDLSEIDGGVYWDFGRADQLLSECPIGYADAVRVPHSLFDELEDGSAETMREAVSILVDMLPGATAGNCPEAYREYYESLGASPATMAAKAKRAAAESTGNDSAAGRHATIGGQ